MHKTLFCAQILIDNYKPLYTTVSFNNKMAERPMDLEGVKPMNFKLRNGRWAMRPREMPARQEIGNTVFARVQKIKSWWGGK